MKYYSAIVMFFVGLCTSQNINNFDKRILSFNVGNFTLTPKDYKFTNQIVVEMWGAGGAGNLYNGHGGSSGGYIKIIMNTMMKTFYLTVGKGGSGSTNNAGTVRSYDFPQSGGDTMFRACDNSTSYVARGGKWIMTDDYSPLFRPYVFSNVINTTRYINIIYNISGSNETLYGINNDAQLNDCPTFNENFDYHCYFGGSAPFGGIGGTPSYYTCSSCGCGFGKFGGSDGQLPGGGGGGSGYNYENINPASSPYLPEFLSKATSGGDGMINIYI